MISHIIQSELFPIKNDNTMLFNLYTSYRSILVSYYKTTLDITSYENLDMATTNIVNSISKWINNIHVMFFNFYNKFYKSHEKLESFTRTVLYNFNKLDVMTQKKILETTEVDILSFSIFKEKCTKLIYMFDKVLAYSVFTKLKELINKIKDNENNLSIIVLTDILGENYITQLQNIDVELEIDENENTESNKYNIIFEYNSPFENEIYSNTLQELQYTNSNINTLQEILFDTLKSKIIKSEKIISQTKNFNYQTFNQMFDLNNEEETKNITKYLATIIMLYINVLKKNIDVYIDYLQNYKNMIFEIENTMETL